MIAPALDALTRHRQFVLYLTEPGENGKLKKIPLTSVTDSTKWMSHDEAERIARQCVGKFPVGFVLTGNSKAFCLDIDGCIQQNGQLSPLAHDLVAMFPCAYVELSVSGTGIHIWGTYTGPIPAHACRGSVAGIELYHENRFIALGTPYAAEGFINGTVGMDCNLFLPDVIAQYFPPAKASATGLEWTTAAVAGWKWVVGR